MKITSHITKYAPFVFFISLFTVITAPALWTEGMFTDGAIYSVIARNLSVGNGSFWHLKFSETLMNPFYGHPPLVFYLESLFYRVFGDTVFPERIYSFTAGIASIFLLYFIINEYNSNKNKRVSFISVLLFLLFPLVSWSFSNNMLENTVSAFVLLSFLFLLKSYSGKRYTMLFLSGIFLFGAFMSKGFTALFIWSVPFFYQTFLKKISIKRMFSDTVFLILFTIIPFFIVLYFSEGAKNFFENYFKEQIIRSLEKTRTVTSRSYIIGSLLNEMIIPTISVILLLIIVKSKKKTIHIKKETLKSSLFFFFIALAGVLPIMVSLKQRSFYIVPALPFLAVSFGFLLTDMLNYFPGFINFFKRKFFLFFSYGMFTISLVMIFIFAGKPGRDSADIYDVKEIKEIIPEGEKIMITKSLYENWSLYAYMQKYGKYSLSKTDNNIWLLSTGKDFIDSTKYQKTNLNLKKYILYKKIK